MQIFSTTLAYADITTTQHTESVSWSFLESVAQGKRLEYSFDKYMDISYIFVEVQKFRYFLCPQQVRRHNQCHTLKEDPHRQLQSQVQQPFRW